MTLALHGKSAKRQAVLIVGALLAILIGALAVLASGGTGARATHVAPVFVAGNPTCDDLGYDNEWKVNNQDNVNSPGGNSDANTSGTYSNGLITAVVTVTDGKYVAWSTTYTDGGLPFVVNGVLIKGGSNANHYESTFRRHQAIRASQRR